MVFYTHTYTHTYTYKKQTHRHTNTHRHTRTHAHRHTQLAVPLCMASRLQELRGGEGEGRALKGLHVSGCGRAGRRPTGL